MQKSTPRWVRKLTHRTAVLAALAASAVGFGQTHSLGQGGLAFFGDRIVRESVPSTAPVVQVSCNYYTVAALRADGTVITWGDNTGQRAMVPNNLTGVVQVASGNSHTLALKADGTVVAWGENGWGQTNVPAGLGNVRSIWAGDNMSFAQRSDGSIVYWGHVPTPPAGLSNLVQILPLEDAVIALRQDGTVVSWGSNGFGQLNYPAGLSGVVQLAGTRYHGLALRSDGTVVAWGAGFNNENTVPAGLNNVVRVATGVNHCLALKSDGSVVGWGYNPFGQATPPASATGVVGIAANYNFSVAIKGDGSVLTFGDSTYNQGVVPNLVGVTRIAGSGSNLAGIRPDGTIAYWGRNDFGQANVPTAVTDAVSVATGLRHGMALRSNGKVVCWGSNSDNQCNVPGGASEVSQIYAGRFHSMAYSASTGSFWCWGNNVGGQCTIPSGLGPVAEIVGGWSHSAVRKQDGTVAVWGDGWYGQKNVPAGLSGMVSLVSGANQLLAVKSDGTVVTWGWNTGDTSAPPAGLNNVVQASAAEYHYAALRSDGTVVGWGANFANQIGSLGSIVGAAKVVTSGDMTAVLLKMHVRVAPYMVEGGKTATGTVYLANPAPAGGQAVNLTTSDSTVATVPATVVVPAGSYSADFPVTTSNPASTTQPLVYASLGALTQRCLLTVVPAPMTVTLTKTSVVGGSTNTVKGTVTLLNPAPVGGATVALSSSSTSCSVSASIVIAAGKTSGTFTIAHSRVALPSNAVITASYSTFTAAATLPVLPFQVKSFTLDQTSVLATLPVTGTVTLNAPPVTPIDVAVASSDPATVPPVVIAIPAGTTSSTGLIQTNPVSTPVTATLTASLDGSAKAVTLKVQKGAATVKFGTATLYGNGAVDCTVTIPVAAPQGGWIVSLSATHCQAPDSVTIPAGQSSVTFTVVADDVATAATATITASAASGTATASRAITPNLINTFTIDPLSFVGGSGTPVSGTVTLKGPVAVDTVVTLASVSPAVLSVPATVTIPAGQSSVTFGVSHVAVAKSKAAKVTATRLGTTKAVTVTVN